MATRVALAAALRVYAEMIGAPEHGVGSLSLDSVAPTGQRRLYCVHQIANDRHGVTEPFGSKRLTAGQMATALRFAIAAAKPLAALRHYSREIAFQDLRLTVAPDATGYTARVYTATQIDIGSSHDADMETAIIHAIEIAMYDRESAVK